MPKYGDFNMTPHEFAELTSLVLSVPTVVLSAAVVWLWGPTAWRALRNTTEVMTGTCWFILGVAAGFLGSLVDNIYWGMAWTASFVHHPWKDWFFEQGVWSNIPFRQTAGIIAAYCHLRAAKEQDVGTARFFNLLLFSCWVLSLGLTFGLLAWR